MTIWLTAAQIASLALPGLPTTERGVQLMAKNGDWAVSTYQWPLNDKGTWRRRRGRGGGIEYHWSLLPAPARAKLAMKGDAETTECLIVNDNTNEPAPPTERGEIWRQFESLPQKRKDEAARRLKLLDAVETLSRGALVLCGGRGSAELGALSTRLRDALTPLGAERRRAFLPHMTLMRSETILPERRIKAIGWTVREIVLVHSLLGKATHRPVGRLPLRTRQLPLPGFDF